jgi:hypothetical protein
MRRDEILQQNELLKDDYLAMVNHLKELHKNGQVILTKKGMKTFQDYVSNENVFNAIG